jgi:hypothetical protein
LPDVDGALAELAYALDDLQLDGVLLVSNARGVYLGDSQFTPQFTPLFDELQRRAAVVFVHPNPSPDPSAHALGLPDTLIDFTADTTRAIAQLHYSSTFARTPTRQVHLRPRRKYHALPGRRFGIIDEMRVIPGAEVRATAARHSAACTGIPRRPGATRAAHAARRRGIDPVVFGTDYP